MPALRRAADAWRPAAEALITELLGPVDLPWLPWGTPITRGEAAAVAVSLVGCDPDSAERCRAFMDLAAALGPGGVLVVADHNRPRGLPAAVWAVVASPAVPGRTPARRWRRLARPTAREVQAAGFTVERLRLVAGERVQVIVARRP
jgi:hypothetical protein